MYEITLIDGVRSKKVIHAVIGDSGFDTLKTSQPKESSPLWYFSKIKDRRTAPLVIPGVMLDWDNEILPNDCLNDNFEYYKHQTHSGRWRIIVPFEKAVTPNLDIFNQIIDCFFNGVSHNAIDRSCFSFVRAYYLCPKRYPLIRNVGVKFKPNVIKFKPSVGDVTKKTVTKAVSVNLEQCKERIDRLYDLYKYEISWESIKTPTCSMGWHERPHVGEIAFNEPKKDTPAFIYCYHANCKNDVNKELSGEVKKFTVGYLTLCVKRGVLTLSDIERCAFSGRLLYKFNDLKYLKFYPKFDAKLWLYILYENILIDRTTNVIYYYFDKYYQELSDENFKHDNQETAGTYFSYFTGKDPKNYIDKLTEYSKAIMSKNGREINKVDGLCLANGVLLFNSNESAFKFVNHSSNYFFKHIQDYEYDATATCSLWEATLAEYFDGRGSAKELLLQEFFGYSLTSVRCFEKLLVLYGVTRGGKNTIVETLLRLVPGDGFNLSLLCNPKEREAIAGKKVLYVNEAVVDQRKRITDELKKLTSTDPTIIRPLYKKAYSTCDVPKLIISFNDVPENLEIDQALRARMLTIKLINSFEGRENIYLKDELLEELPGILNWALKGYLRLFKNKCFTQCLKDTHELYLSNKTDEPLEKIAEFMREKAGIGKIKANLLHSEFNSICDEIDKMDFSKHLSRLGYQKIRRKDGVYYLIR